MGAVMRNSNKTKPEATNVYDSRGFDPKLSREANDVIQCSEVTKSDVAYLSLWDMGGHEVFQSSHNVFISSHGVYLLVFRLTDFLRDNQETDRLKKWIRLIGTFSSNDPRFKIHAPPIIFVGTFLDELKKSSKDYHKDIVAILMSISEFPELLGIPCVKFCTVDNSLGNDDAELEKLRGLITESAVHQDQWERQIPTTWLKLELDVFKAREEGTRILTLADFIEMNKKSIAPLENEEEIQLALEYLHCTRSVIYFRELNYVITDPQWLADFFSVFISDLTFLPRDDIRQFRKMRLYQTKGELSGRMIRDLLHKKENRRFIPYQSPLLALMQKFGLIVKVQISGTVPGQVTTETYIIPSKLKVLQDVNDITSKVARLQQLKEHFSKTLCFVFNDTYTSNELFQRILACVMKMYKLTSLPTRSEKGATAGCAETSVNKECLYNGFACFEIDGNSRMILSMHAERSTMALTAFSTSADGLPDDSGKVLRQSIERIIQETLQLSNQQHFQFTLKLHCSFYLTPYDTPVHLYRVINSESGVPCKGGECQGQHRLSKTDAIYWGIEEGSGDARHDLDVSSTGIDINMDNRRPTPRELGRLSRLVSGSGCDMLFAALGLPYPEREQTKWESKSLAGITIITKMFLKWTNTYPNQTFHHIREAMEMVDMATDRLDEVLESDEDSENQGGLVPIDVGRRVPCEQEIMKIADNIGNAYFNLFLELELSPPTIEQQEVRYPDNIKSRLVALIRCWKDKFQTRATIGRLLTAMQYCQMDWQTTAEIWSTRPGKSGTAMDS
ncbi:cyclic GMP-binding protein C-like [Argopecten irradians]|uniref:cyclic GMP-binding protein C-like n=1 Tax=Argopecten irradians TaxID=31199 RepID=UPI0037163CA0